MYVPQLLVATSSMECFLRYGILVDRKSESAVLVLITIFPEIQRQHVRIYTTRMYSYKKL